MLYIGSSLVFQQFKRGAVDHYSSKLGNRRMVPHDYERSKAKTLQAAHLLLAIFISFRSGYSFFFIYAVQYGSRFTQRS
jgi:hypothetical protein